MSLKWQGQCPACGGWNTLQPLAAAAPRSTRTGPVQRLTDVDTGGAVRPTTGLAELDRVLGGGLVPGSVVLVGGPPGIGKSTLLLQVACTNREHRSTLYASGEESLEQIASRAARLGSTPLPPR